MLPFMIFTNYYQALLKISSLNSSNNPVCNLQIGEGWKDSHPANAEPTADRDSKMDRRVVVTVTGRNVGYGATCEYLVQCAAVILQEADRLPVGGGVYTPGYAFARTSLVDR